MSFFVHESSYVDDGVIIGNGTKVWHFCHLSERSSVGESCVLGQNVYVGPEVKIGNRVKIQNNVSVYAGVELQDGVFCGPSVVFTNVKTPRAFVDRKEEFSITLIKEGASLGANSTIICGIEVGKYALIAAGAVVTKSVPNYAIVAGVAAEIVGWASETGRRLDLPVSGFAQTTCPDTGKNYRLDDGLCYMG